MPKPLFGDPKPTAPAVEVTPLTPHVAQPPAVVGQTAVAPATTRLTSESQIKRLTLEEINGFGAEAMRKLGTVNEDLLKRTKASSLAEAGSGLSDLLVASQAYDPKNLGKTKGLLFKAKLTFAQLRTNFDSVHSQVEQLAVKVDSTVTNLHRQITDMEKMFDGAKQNYFALDIDIKNLEQRIADEEAYPPQFNESDPFEATEKQAWMSRIAQAKGHLGTLRLQQQFAAQLGVMIKTSAQNAAQLIQKFTGVKTFTIPSMKQTFVFMVEQLYQKQAVELDRAIEEANSKAIRTNAKLFGENTKAIAEQAAKAPVRIEDLQYSNDVIIQALQDVKSAQEVMVKRVNDELPQLQDMAAKLRTAQTA